MAIDGVSIMVRKPLNMSDIILAILVLVIVYSNGKVCVKKGVVRGEIVFILLYIFVPISPLTV